MNETRLLQNFLEDHIAVLKRVLCPCCNGTGTTTFGWHSDDPAVFTQSDFEEDPDLYYELREGAYDKTCPECGGRNVVDAIDYERTPLATVKAWEEYLADEYEYDAVCRAERAMGA